MYNISSISLFLFLTLASLLHVSFTHRQIIKSKTLTFDSGGARPRPAGARAPVGKGFALAVPQHTKWANINRVNSKD